MADELTGPDAVEGEPEVRYTLNTEVATPDEEAADPAPPPADDPLDRELAKQLNVDQLPADPQELKQLVTKRYGELRTGTRKAFDERAESEKQMAVLQGKLEQLTTMVTGAQTPARKELPVWAKDYKAPPGASEVEVLADFVEHGIQNAVGTELQQLQQMRYDMGMERVTGMLTAAQAKVGSEEDWATVEPKIQYALERNFTLDEALDFALASTGLIGNRIKQEIADQQSAKRQAVGGTVTTPGVTKTTSKMPFDDIRKASWRDVVAWAAEESERDLARQ